MTDSDIPSVEQSTERTSTQRAERFFNGAVGVSLLAWAILGWVQFPFSGVRLAVSTLNVTVGLLFLTRRCEVQAASWTHHVRCIPSLLAVGLLFRLAPEGHAWPIGLQVLFGGATLFVIAAFLSLGRSFAVLPSLRVIRRSGLYRVVRHPAYLGELVMSGCCAVAAASIGAGLLFALLVAGLVLRIAAEEELLTTDRAYRAYQGVVRWRLVPKLW